MRGKGVKTMTEAISQEIAPGSLAVVSEGVSWCVKRHYVSVGDIAQTLELRTDDGSVFILDLGTINGSERWNELNLGSTSPSS